MSQLGAPSTHNKSYRADIDGLRAVAVLAVVLFHAFPDSLPGGFAGVDIFFVISGFLISGIIFSDLERGTFSITGFYTRRVRRIFPSLLTVFAAVFILGWLILLPLEFKKLGKHFVGSGIFSSNFVLWHESGYFDASSVTKPLLHFWSLAIEEQFYLGWPWIMYLAWRFRRNHLPIILTLISLSFVVNIFLSNKYPTAGYYMPVARFWELFIGAALFELTRLKPNLLGKHSIWTALLGMILIILSFILIDSTKVFPGWWGLLPTFGAFFLMAGPDNWISRNLLSNRIFVGIGLISYPIYLWHWPLLAFLWVNHGDLPPTAARVGAVVASLVLAFATYWFVERNLRFRKGRSVTIGLVLGLGFWCIVGGLMWLGMFRPRLSNEKILVVAEVTRDFSFPERMVPRQNQQGVHIFSTGSVDTQFILGDSHIQQYVVKFTQEASANPQAKTLVVATRGGCPPIPEVEKPWDPGCSEWVESQFQTAKSDNNKSVLIGGCWNCYFSADSAHDEASSIFMRDAGGGQHPLSEKAGQDLAFAALEKAVSEISSRKKVYLVLDNPIGDVFNPARLIKGDRLFGFKVDSPSDSTPVNPREFPIRQRLIEIARRANAEILDPWSVLCSDKNCLVAQGGVPIYMDQNHLRAGFVRKHATFLDPAFR
ncbi:MAG TPA: acyltransferase family protein [Fibrobacteria bacterium]|nr:acyltransferase family protein [Fibrobacteria bacterium]